MTADQMHYHLTFNRGAVRDRYEMIPGRGFAKIEPPPFTRVDATPDVILEQARKQLWWMAIRQQADVSITFGYPDQSSLTFSCVGGELHDQDGGRLAYKTFLDEVEDHLWQMALYRDKEAIDA